MLGLQDGKVVLVEHDPAWKRAYQEDEASIRNALGTLALDVQHCGSTAVPGIRAKPILDILVGVAQLADGPACILPLASIGYAYLGDTPIPDEHFFGRGSPRTHHLHLVEHRGSAWLHKISFRDRLLADRALACDYESTKIALARRFQDDRAAYTRAKADFIAAVIADMSAPS